MDGLPDCLICDGSGKVPCECAKKLIKLMNKGFKERDMCPKCCGQGHIIKRRRDNCPKCDGTGKIKK